MNLLRFKAPALIELITTPSGPNVFSTTLTRDIKVINAFGFGGSGTVEGASFRVYASSGSNQHSVLGPTVLRENETNYSFGITADSTTLRIGWTLRVEITGTAQANVYIWVIPLPKQI
jgi:hypothetical protein